MMVRRAEKKKRFEKRPVSERISAPARVARATGRGRESRVGRESQHDPARSRSGGSTHLHAPEVSRSRRASRCRALDEGSLRRHDRACATSGYRRSAPRRARAEDRRAARCESRLVAHPRLGSPVVASNPTRRPADRATTRPRLAQCRAPTRINKKKSAGTFHAGGGGNLFVIFVTACALGGTRFSAAARFCRGNRRRRRFDGALHAARDSHRVRRATSHASSACFVDTQHPRA